jgi:glutaminyl-tRNA synthetase
MPTLCGFRRRGYSPEGIRKFVDKIGYTTFDALNDFALLESAVREDLNARSTRVSAVLHPVKLIVTNYPEGQVEEMEAINNPENLEEGTHTIEFSRELWIEQEDFMEDAPKKFFRLGPGKQVRLKNSYIIQCPENLEDCVVKDAEGNIVEIHAELIPETKTGQPNSNMKIKGKTIHWVSCKHCLEAEVRNYDRLWMVENPRDEVAAYSKEHGDVRGIEAMRPFLNPNSLEVKKAYVEKWLATRKPMDYLQFQRIGYYNVDPDSTPDHLVFNRTVGLTDSWKKINK